MAEFQEVMYQMHRFCNSMTCDCQDCEIYQYSNGVCLYDIRMKDNGAALEKKIMSWAANHPEPKYPTWRQWLIRQGLVDFKPYWSPNIPTGNTTIACLSSKALEPISADIAEKLGIEPKEG